MAVATVRAPAISPQASGPHSTEHGPAEQTPPHMPPYTQTHGPKAPYTRLSDTLDYLERWAPFVMSIH